MRALIIGATGATGKDLVSVLLSDPAYTEVVTFVRRRSGNVHNKLFEVLTDFDHPEQVTDSIHGDVWFSCLGTTIKIAGTKENQWHIDYEIPVKFAGLAKDNGVPCAVLLSSFGASSASKVFYSQMKGKLEEKIGSLAFERYIVFKPGLLVRKNSDRPAERVMGGVLNFMNRIGFLKKFKPMPTEVLAEKLAKAPKVFGAGKHVVALDEIHSFY